MLIFRIWLSVVCRIVFETSAMNRCLFQIAEIRFTQLTNRWLVRSCRSGPEMGMFFFVSYPELLDIRL